jgi:DNA-3-methyladenine glycosylase II
MTRVTRITMAEAAAELGRLDPDFKRLVAEHGLPGLRSRPSGYGTLLKVISGQQVSTHAARAINRRLDAVAKPMTPEIFMTLTDADLRAIGFSGQKMSYGRAIAQAVLDGSFSFRRVARMDDEAAIEEMVKLRGVGHWTAQIYLMFALRRPDMWPVDDLGIALGYAALKGLKKPLDRKRLLRAGELYRPWRSIASHLLWHYLHAVRDGRKTV